ncbi:MAG TPA: ArsA family ATPase [Egibacteraceae bacterium]|nr:ArsA family ATPase [Egibacteraceae bacterium]
MTRVLLFTGKGGVGKTSVAAATALRAARAGHRTLVMSTDPAHSLADSFGVPLGPHPTPVAENLAAEQIDAQRRLEDNWREIRSYLVSLLSWGGVDTVEAEELSVIPGLEEIFSLIDVREHVAAGAYDLLVVDCAPTAETLRLLSLPDALGWYLERIFPVERKVARVVRPVLGRMTTMPLPQDRLFGAVDALYRNLEAVREILRDQTRTSVRLVVNAEKMVIAEARRTYTYLNLFGYHVDAVVINRLLPDAVTDPWFERWKALQSEHVATVEAGFAGVPVLRAPLFDEELVGTDALERLGAAVYGDRDATQVFRHTEPLRFERTDDGGYAMQMTLPFVDRTDVDVFRAGDEVHVKVDAHHRSVLLPAALARCEVTGAGMRGGVLEVRFAVPTGGHQAHA